MKRCVRGHFNRKYLMFPSVAKEDVRDKIKEKTWDDRFGTKSGIPEYSPLKDKHTKNYRKSLKKEDSETKEGKPAREGKRTYFEKRMELMDELATMHRPHEKLLEEYEELAGKHKLPNFYIYYSLLPLRFPTASVPQYLFNEKKLMKQQATHYHRISTAVKAREECLQRLRSTLGQLSQEKMEQKRGELKEEVGHLRFLTENVIDEIKRWRDTLGIEQRAIYYNDNQENYLIRLLNDNHFIFNSKLALALSFADKNDPFLLAPLRRAQGKEASLFLEILTLSKDPAHYQKYMEYLASEKAHELSQNPPQRQLNILKHPSEKIYRPVQKPSVEPIPLKQEPDEEAKKMEALKMREERLKKNEERIKSIKSIYETYSRKAEEKHYRSERKLPETDSEDRRGRKRVESIKPIRLEEPARSRQEEGEFDAMVRARVEGQRVTKTPVRRSAGRSGTKITVVKSEDRMIESLRDIQSTLRSKLQVIQQEGQLAASTLAPPTVRRRNNDQIIKQLKQQILGKIEKEAQEKQRLRKVKREQEQRVLEEVKAKLKREMEEKLEQKKREKLLQRQELERKLKQEEERLNGQKQLQLQLQLKLNKEKELRELEKIRRESLQREKKYREELEKEQALRKSKEEDVERERKEKEKLAEELRKRQIREQIEQELRMEVKAPVEPKEDIGALRTAKEAELAKELETLKMRQGLELEQLRRENQLRERMLRLKKEEEELKRKEIEQLMREAVQAEKSQLAEEAAKRRQEIEENMRANVKEKLLEEYRNEKEAQVEQMRLERQAQLEEEVYREKIRQKIEREMRIQAIQRTKQELDQREGKKQEIRSKLEQVKSHFDRDVTVDRSRIEQEVKKEVVERVIFDKQAQRQAAKQDLRMQFEKELFTSAVPQIYAPSNTFQVKDINYFQGDHHLNSKLTENRPTNQKPAPSNDSPTKPKQLIDSMTIEQLQVYEKQKQKVNEMKEERIPQVARTVEQQEGFEQVSIPRRDEQGFEVKPVLQHQSSIKQKEGKSAKQQLRQKSKRKKKQKQDSEEEDSEDSPRKKKHKKRHYYDDESQDSQDAAKKRSKAKRKRKNSSEDPPSSQERPKQKSPTKTQQQERPSEQEKKSSPNKKQPSQKRIETIEKQPSEKGVVHFDAEKSKLKYNPVDEISFKPQKAANNSQKFKMSLEAIPEAEFDEYLEVHLSRVPQAQLSIQLHSREQLYRKLIGELTFCLLVGQFEGRVIGLALAYHDRNRQDVRKFTIIHLATYRLDDLKDFILSCTNFIFRKDPVDEIQFHYRFDENDSEQASFSTDFNKWFDKYGSVFQKKTEEGVYERKYVLKRQFNQKCEVILGGVNKNTFRNLFTVYCGVLMSDTDMLQFKQELIDTLAPQNQVCYSIMVSELFRTYLSPDEAEALKNKVKQFVKLKEMLVLVVMMQKKKLKLDQLKLYQYKTLIELNMRLMSQGKDIIRYCKDSSGELNRLYYAELSHAFNLPFHFQTTSLPVESKENQVRQISYFRLSCLPPFKLHIIKSSLYNAEMNILPTENSKYKLFVLSAQEYNELKQASHLDLFMYIRLFLKNVKSHNVAVWKYVWLPEMTDRGAWNLREYRSFLNKDFYTHDSLNITYRQFLPGALIIEPEHRDLVITPPFIVGIMSMALEQVSEGSPIYARMIELDALKTLEVETTLGATQ